jgi:hypothetical protein
MGEAVAHRDEAVSMLSRQGGLGPPDLCWFRKTTLSLQDAVTNDDDDDADEFAEGAYHWVLGLDTSSQASIAAYFVSLETALERPNLLGKMIGFWTAQPTWRVEGGVFCCYDAFSRMDVRCEITVPGGVTAYAVSLISSPICPSIGRIVPSRRW